MARRLTPAMVRDYDLILAMDAANLAKLRRLAPIGARATVRAMLDGADTDRSEVPDPYYGGREGFSHVLDLVEMASEGLLREIVGADPLG